MIKVYIYPFNESELHDNMFVPSGGIYDSRDNVQLLVFKYLKENCLKEGIDLHTCDYFDINSNEKSVHIFMRQWPFEHLAGKKNVVLGAYYIWEPPVLINTYPEDQYNNLERISQVFHKVYAAPTFNSIRAILPDLSPDLQISKTFLHQPYDSVVESLWKRKDRNFLTLIANYNLCSLKKNELYTERIKAIKFFSDKGLELYGNNWGQVETYKNPKSFFYNLRKLRSAAIKGTLQGELLSFVSTNAILRAWTRCFAPHKLQTLSRYQFSICYESSIFEGFVTEKIFDCMAAGTIPIYWGAPDIYKYVPKCCFIDKREFSSYSMLYDFLTSLSEEDINSYRTAAKSYFNTPLYKPFTKEVFAKQFIDDVYNFFKCSKTT